MKSRLVAYCCACLMLLWAGQSLADDRYAESGDIFPERLNAQQLLTACNASSMTNRGRQNRYYCDGFISGVEEAVRVYQPVPDCMSHARICMPPATSTRELRNIITRYATRYKNELGKPAAQFTLSALQWAYPCQNSYER